jgi:acyl-homoserine-lactone acylase
LSSARAAALLYLIAVQAAGCASIGARGGPAADERLARTVTIMRDGWRIPAVHASTDAGVAFGLAWAQAEDNYWQVEEDYIHALGRAAEYYGESYLAADLVKRAFEVERLSREEYAREPPERQAVWDGWAAGMNHFMRSRGVQPRLITRWEPWMPFALFRVVRPGALMDGVRLGHLADVGFQLVGEWDADALPAPPSGSNMWAVAPTRTVAGHALLFQNPHVAFFGAGQRYEALVQSEAGWHVRGFAVLGTPVLRAGHTSAFAWSHTNSAADNTDVYAVRFDHPEDGLLYRYDGEWRRATQWTDTVRLNTADGVAVRAYTFRRTHHGPIVARRGEEWLAARVGRMEEGGSLQQWYAINRARDYDEFRAALDGRSFTISNTMYADTTGRIWYIHGNAVPRRPAGHDWDRPVPGNTAATEWQGWHDLDELPQLLDPPAGWLQNTNSTPFLATAEGANPDPAAYPAYMAPEQDNARARSSRRILAADTAWTFEALQRAAFDTHVGEADGEVALLVQEWEQVGGRDPFRAMQVDEALDLLRDWDRVSTTESEAMTVYVFWQERLRANGSGPAARFRALEEAVAALRRDHGTVRVPWGVVNRLQRVHTSGTEPFDEDAPSLPVPGAEGWTGVIFRFTAVPGPGGRQRFGRSGHTWVSVTELAPEVRSRAVVQFGQSADPRSPHHFDQAPLYVRGELRDAPFTADAARAAAVRTYQPGPAQ